MLKTQHLQNQTTNRKTELHFLYLKMWPFIRIIQVLQFLMAATLLILDTPYSSLGLILLGISSITSIYALELALRLANIMEQDKPNMPRLAHS